MKNRQPPNLIIWLYEHLPKDMWHIVMVFYLVLAAQGLSKDDT